MSFTQIDKNYTLNRKHLLKYNFNIWLKTLRLYLNKYLHKSIFSCIN